MIGLLVSDVQETANPILKRLLLDRKHWINALNIAISMHLIVFIWRGRVSTGKKISILFKSLLFCTMAHPEIYVFFLVWKFTFYSNLWLIFFPFANNWSISIFIYYVEP